MHLDDALIITGMQGGLNKNTLAVNLQYLGNRSGCYYEIYTVERELNNRDVHY